jgi:predicted nucleic acid-binding protein
MDVLRHARDGNIDIYTSCWTLVETIRPRDRYIPEALPDWSRALDATNEDGEKIYPNAKNQLEQIWSYYKRNTVPSRLLSQEQADKIKEMFSWSWIRKIQVVPTIAASASEIARKCNMKPADSLHVASALSRGCQLLHRWDRDYQKTDHLVPSMEPVRISPPDLLSELPPPAN